jgi:hypothetical protein
VKRVRILASGERNVFGGVVVEDDDLPNDLELFDITDVKVEYHRTRDQRRVTASIKDTRPISEMKLYLILDIECRKLERRLGIHDGDADVTH